MVESPLCRECMLSYRNQKTAPNLCMYSTVIRGIQLRGYRVFFSGMVDYHLVVQVGSVIGIGRGDM